MDKIIQLLRILKIGAYALIGLLGFLLFIDLIRAYQVLFDFSPVSAYLYALALFLFLAWVMAMAVCSYLRHPAIMFPPKNIGPKYAGGRLRMARYTVKYAERLGTNPNLNDESRDKLQVVTRELNDLVIKKVETDKLDNAQSYAQETIDQILFQCDEIAERAVRDTTRDVMITVTLSPWRAVDLALVLWRNIIMVGRVVSVYNSRPLLSEQLRIYRDVFMVVVTVNFLNIGSRLLQNLAISLPLLGRFADDIAQGVGAGLMTSVVGHSTIARCRSFTGWDEEKEREKLGGRLKKFAQDVKKILSDDVIPRIKQPIEAKYASENREDKSNEIQNGIEGAVEETFGKMDSFLVRPTKAISRGAVSAGVVVGDYTAATGRTISSVTSASKQSIVRGSKKLGSATKNAFISVGKKIKKPFSTFKSN